MKHDKADHTVLCESRAPHGARGLKLIENRIRKSEFHVAPRTGRVD